MINSDSLCVVDCKRNDLNIFFNTLPIGSFVVRKSSLGTIKCKVPLYIDDESPVLVFITCPTIAVTVKDCNNKMQHTLLALYLSKGLGYASSINSKDKKTNLYQWGEDYKKPEDSINTTWYCINTGNYEDILNYIPFFLKTTFKFPKAYNCGQAFIKFRKNVQEFEIKYTKLHSNPDSVIL